MKINCPHCGQHYDVEETDLGKEADCTNCGKRFSLQPTVAPVIPAQPVPSLGACPYCGGEITPGVKKCRHCGEWIEPSAKPLSPAVYVILALLLGGIGMHNFVAKQRCSGIEKILLTLMAWRIIYVWPHHPLGYMVLVGLGILILADIVMFCRDIKSPLSVKARQITAVVTTVFLLAFYIYGISYQGEVGAVEASYAISCYDPATCSEQEAHLRMTRLMNWPLADSAEIRKAVHKGIKDGMEIKEHMDARLNREKSSAPPVRF